MRAPTFEDWDYLAIGDHHWQASLYEESFAELSSMV